MSDGWQKFSVGGDSGGSCRGSDGREGGRWDG